MDNYEVSNAQFIVDDLLDFPKEDEEMLDESMGIHSGDSSTDVNTVVDSCNSSFSDDIAGRRFSDDYFSNNLGVPYDHMAELEWLSNFEEESFSNEDLQNLQRISGIKPRNEKEDFQIRASEDQKKYPSEVYVPGKARSKRSRIAPGDWTSRLLAWTQASGTRDEKKIVSEKKKDPLDDDRRCLHCATDKTPQWRTGPMGPKTLCNACGVRYKSGRLVPEYRPASSPTFMLTKHSNSHRKVMELRRQKEVHRVHQHHQHQSLNRHGMMYDISNGDDYSIHQHTGPDFRHLF